MQAPKGIRHKHKRLHYKGVSIKASELILGLAFPGRIVLSLIERCPYKVRLDSASFPAFYVFYVREYARKNYAKVEIHPDSSLHRGVYSLNFIRLLRVVITPSVTERRNDSKQSDEIQASEPRVLPSVLFMIEALNKAILCRLFY